MRKLTEARLASFIFPLIVAVALLASACGGTAPQELEIPVKLTAGALDPETINVGQNDTVTLKIEADQSGTFHLHGYDLEQEAKSGEVTDFAFLADASGRFRIAFHAAGDGHDEAGHGEIFQSEVIQPGDTFSLEVTQDIEGKMIAYHSHLHPEISGSVHVSADAPSAVAVMVEIRDGEIDPSEVMVRPGSSIIWTNNSSGMQALTSGPHPDAMADSHDDMAHMDESADTGHSHQEAGEGDEIDIGFLEVQPR